MATKLTRNQLAGPEPRAKILLVEDDAVPRAAMARILARRGFEVWEASNGEEAIRLASQPGAAFDGVVTDIVMPRIDGIEAARQLERLLPNTPIIFVSAFPDGSAGRIQELRTRTEFISKPFAPERLIASLETLLELPVVAV